MKSKIKENENKITHKNNLFVKYYLFGIEGEFGVANGTKSYAKAYGHDISDKKKENVCASEASRLLRNVKIRQVMRETLNEDGFDDETVDARLLEIIRNGSNMESIRAIHEYNKMKQRLTEKINVHVSNPLDQLLREISDNDIYKNSKMIN